MPERDPRNNVIDFFEMFVPNLADFVFHTGFVDNEGRVREEGLVRIFGTTYPEVYNRAKNNVKSNKRTSRRCRI